jgi:alpha-ketoglutarate-dependent taurine dioxygenase
MKIRALKNYSASVGVEVYDIDLNSDEEILEFGRLVASQCIVLVDQKISTQRLFEIQTQWGRPSRALIHDYIVSERLNGRHWREIYLHLGYTTKDIRNVDKQMISAVSAVTYKKDEKNRPKGLFPNGELDWHSDQCAYDDSPRVIGLQSVSDTANSCTQFLCTHDAFDSMSADMQSTVKELYCKHRWVEGRMAPDLEPTPSLVIRYNQAPLDGTETRLYAESVTGLPGIKFPAHSFDGFVGMSMDESVRLFDELKRIVYNNRWVYSQHWQDGQIVFMDQEITLHKRPTNVKDGDRRTMARVITYWDKLYEHAAPMNTLRFKGETITHDQFASLVDQERRRIFEEEQHDAYLAHQ